MAQFISEKLMVKMENNDRQHPPSLNFSSSSSKVKAEARWIKSCINAQTLQKPYAQHINLAHCWRSLAPRFVYRKRTVRVAFPLEYSPNVYQSTELKIQETIY